MKVLKCLFLFSIALGFSFPIADAQTKYIVTIENLSFTADPKESIKSITPGHKVLLSFSLKTNAEHLAWRGIGIYIDGHFLERKLVANQNDFSLSIVLPKRVGGDFGVQLNEGPHKLNLKVGLSAGDMRDTDVKTEKTIDFVIGQSGSVNNPITNDTQSLTESDKSLSTNDLSATNNSLAKIEIEKNNATGVSYEGVVADGIGSLRIQLTGITGNRIKFSIPLGLGYLKYKGGVVALNESKIEQYIDVTNGTATVFYHPPRYVDPAVLNKTITITETRVYYVDVPITFNYEDAGGSKQTVSSVKLFRPKVVLVHGFTGDASTWSELATHLSGNKFDSMSENYYALNDNWGYLKCQDVYAQSRKLSEDIIKAKNIYQQAGVKMLKVDVVAHSMGGLIARYYVNGYNPYNGDIRKLFMVGTPNHGIGNIKQVLGAAGSATSGSHWGMLDDVYEQSEFMFNLNVNEKSGGHLNPDVQYYNIYGTVDDGVTNEASAYIPGIEYTRIRKCCHSPSPPPLILMGPPLTTHPDVFSKVTEYLQKEIGRLPLKNIKANIISLKGDVWVDDLTQNKQVQNTPYPITAYDKIRVKENSAIEMAFTLDGKEWGRLITGQSTSLQMRNFSPQVFSVRVVKGRAKFKSEGLSHFTVDIVPDSYSKREWFTFNPIVDVNGLGTTFNVIYENGIAKVNLIEGAIRLDDHNTGQFGFLTTPQTIVYNASGNVAVQPLQADAELEGVDFSKVVNNLFDNVSAGGSIVDAATLGSGDAQLAQPDGNTTGSTVPNCVGQLKLQFIQKTGATSDPQAQAAMRQIDNENRREYNLFNQAVEDFKKGILPKEISGNYSRQETKTPMSREYYCETVTLFKPMKVTKAVCNSSGFKLFKDMAEFKQFGNNQEAVGTVLPCGSYKVYPNSDIPFASAKLTLEEN